ncbi:MAG: thiamine phosphate synthase [Candidatus Brocadiia bacterium]
MIPHADFSLCLVTDPVLAGSRTVADIVGHGIAGGVTLVQLRDKDADGPCLLRQAIQLKSMTDNRGVPLIINDRLEVALACGAAGVHLGQGDLACSQARRIAPDIIIGISVSSVDEALAAERDGADYLGISPVFSTPTKTDTPPAVGLDGLRRIRDAVRLPLVAIGGINASNAGEVILAGANGLAVVSAIMAAADPCAAARLLREEIDRARAKCGQQN